MKRNAEDDVAEARAEELASKKRKVDQDDDDDDVEDEEEKEENTSMQQYTQAGVFRRKCPYLDTVSRQKLDFDQQKICSVTLTNMNVYACLVCGKFFQGRGKSTPAFTHSVQAGHFVFINLQDTRTFCLPDGYEIVDAALNDVKKCLAPSFAPNEVSRLNSNSTLARDVYGVSYLPGFVGLNNLKSTDYLNVVLHAFSHISPLRDFFLLPDNYAPKVPSGVIHGSAITRAFGEVVRKMWSKDNFKSVISPQEFMHVVTSESKNRFVVGQQSEAIDLFVWLMGELHRQVCITVLMKAC
jgi:U4/U6.U5 tri-snRNP-associated protein 2